MRKILCFFEGSGYSTLSKSHILCWNMYILQIISVHVAGVCTDGMSLSRICSYRCRFMPMVPSGWIFIILCILLRMAEGVGSALFGTALITLIPILYPKSVGTLVVSALVHPLCCSYQYMLLNQTFAGYLM